MVITTKSKRGERKTKNRKLRRVNKTLIKISNMIISKFTTIVVLIISIGVLLFFTIYLLNYIPHPNEFVTNITFEKYSNILYEYEIMKYPSKVEVTQVGANKRLGIGFVVDTWNLNFGSVPAGGSSTRFMDLSNIGEREAKIIFRAYGNITPFVGFSKNNFILYPKDNITIKITFSSQSDTKGNYTGEIDRIIKMPKYNFLYIFI